MPVVIENTLRLELLKRFTNNRVFIETGTSKGDGISVAIAAGFEYIYSIDNDPELYDITAEKFKQDLNVKLYFGDSDQILSELLSNINELVTFWLDAHTGKSSSILEELTVIADHDIKTHTILIDDMRYFRKRCWGISFGQILAALNKINPYYLIEYVDGSYKHDILVAYYE